MANTAVLEILGSQKLISRKIYACAMYVSFSVANLGAILIHDAPFSDLVCGRR